MKKKLVAVIITSLLVSAGCLREDSSSEEQQVTNGPQPINITNAIFSNTNVSCAAYIGEYVAEVTDVSNDQVFTARVNISSENDECTIFSNGLPNHDFAVNGSFASKTSEVWESYTIPLHPQIAEQTTALSLRYDNAVFLNGVKLDLLAAGFFRINREGDKIKVGGGVRGDGIDRDSGLSSNLSSTEGESETESVIGV